ncbi:MAG: D-alanyl-D-alanine carboxypeptidase family protein [Alphaproteobacteria bacterium]
MIFRPTETALKFLQVFIVAILVPTAWTATATAQDIETNAKQAMLIDLTSRAVLLEKNADERMFPASMTKMMTAYIVFERLRDGTLSLQDEFTVSEKAWRKGGSKMFVEVGNKVSVEDLLRGIIIQSGNDATIVVAEGLSGSEDAFADEMNATARSLGMMHTNFKNASGWPHPDHYTTARDLMTLAIASIEQHPEFYHMYSETSFTYHDIEQGNRNPLLYRDIGADGLKTGHTEASGYGLTASAVNDGRRLVLVINGMESSQERADEGVKLLTWGFREWNSYDLFAANETVDTVPVWLGEQPSVALYVDEPLTVTMRRRARKDLKVTAHYTEPVPAPITAGTVLGEVTVTAPGIDPVSLPLKAAGDVGQLGAVGRLKAAVNYLVWGNGS